MTRTSGIRPTWAEINLKNLAFNFRSVRKFVGQDLKYMAVVKADAYGHGDVECARTLEETGADCFGVALPEEGLRLRRNGIKIPIICLGGFWNGQENLLLENNLATVVYRLEMLENLNRAAAEKGVKAAVHVKVDTGMGRIGIRFEHISEFAENLKKYKNLSVQGLMTHFAAADDLSQNKFTNLQIEKFNKALEIFEEKGFSFLYKDLANSPGAIAHKSARGNMVRLGGVLYGLGDDVIPAGIDKPNLRAVLSLHSRVAFVKTVLKGETLGYSRTFKTKRNSIIASIPIGYHDGYSRALSNCGRVIINNNYAPVVGRISMDWTLVDVTNVPRVNVGDEVILIGSKGKLVVNCEDLASLSKTISYEITCGISDRVIKDYVS